MKPLYIFVFLSIFLAIGKANCSYSGLIKSPFETEFEVNNKATIKINDANVTFDVEELLVNQDNVLFTVNVDTGDTHISNLFVVPMSIYNYNIKGGVLNTESETKASSTFSVKVKSCMRSLKEY